MSKVKDQNMSLEGQKRLDWAEYNMPILKSIRERFELDKPLEGIRIGVALHLEKKTGILLKTLKTGGAEIYAASCNPLTTDDHVAAALADEMNIFAWAGQTDHEYYECLNSVIKGKPQVIIDDGCDLIQMIHNNNELISNVIGACEETTTGISRLQIMDKENALKFPVIAVNNAYSKYLFDNRYGTGQSVIEGILSATNTLIAGKTVVVLGYGWCGRGIANRLKGLGAKIVVVEAGSDNNIRESSGFHRALEATYDGCWVMNMNDASPIGDIFITATGNKHVIRDQHMKMMKDGAILANSGHFNHEIDLDGLESISSSKNEILTNVEKYKLKNGKHLILLSEGRLVNLSQPTGQGHPIEIMDGSFGIQSLSVEHLVLNGEQMSSNVHDVPNNLDNEIARLALESQNIVLDMPTELQKNYKNNWEEGT